MLALIVRAIGRLALRRRDPLGAPAGAPRHARRSAPPRFCCLGIALTAAIPSEDAAAPIINALLLPLYFLSGVFIPETEIPNGVLHFADIFPIRHFFEAFFDAYVPDGGSAVSMGQPRGRRGLGRRRPAARDPLLPLDPARRASLRHRDGRRIASGPMLHHVLLEVSDLDRERRVLRLAARRRSAGAAISRRTRRSAGASPNRSSSSPPITSPQPGFGLLCFSGLGIVAVKAAWEGGVGAGGTNAARPASSRSYGSGSYSAFLQDPDGYEIEIRSVDYVD